MTSPGAERSDGGKTIQERWAAVMMDNYGTPPVALSSGEGAVVTDVDGKRYLDLLGGIAVNVLGHRHPAIIEAVTRQLNTLGHTSNLYMHEPGIALAETLVGLLGADAETRVFFCNSGAEGRVQTFASDPAHETRCGTRGFSRAHDGVARADGPTEQAGAVRSAAGRGGACALRRRRCAGRCGLR